MKTGNPNIRNSVAPRRERRPFSALGPAWKKEGEKPVHVQSLIQCEATLCDLTHKEATNCFSLPPSCRWVDLRHNRPLPCPALRTVGRPCALGAGRMSRCGQCLGVDTHNMGSGVLPSPCKRVARTAAHRI
eukprot:362180-Chlamydomonas_euryale.AAC.3